MLTLSCLPKQPQTGLKCCLLKPRLSLSQFDQVCLPYEANCFEHHSSRDKNESSKPLASKSYHKNDRWYQPPAAPLELDTQNISSEYRGVGRCANDGQGSHTRPMARAARSQAPSLAQAQCKRVGRAQLAPVRCGEGILSATSLQPLYRQGGEWCWWEGRCG